MKSTTATILVFAAVIGGRAAEPGAAPESVLVESPLPQPAVLVDAPKLESMEPDPSEPAEKTESPAPRKRVILSQQPREEESQLLRKKRAAFYGLLGAAKSKPEGGSFLAQFSLFQPLTESEKSQPPRPPLSWRDPVRDDMQGWVLIGVQK